MGGGDLNTKKSWHPSTLKNQERVWKAEQAAAEEKKRIVELQREREQESDRAQLNEMAQQNFGTGGVNQVGDNRLHWMYDKPDKQVQHEDYLLGKEIGKNDMSERPQHAIPAVSRRVVGSSMTKSLDDTQVDLVRKMREDPLLLVKERERAARAALLNNPLQRKRLADLLRKEKEQKESKEDSKTKKKKDKNLDDMLAAKLNALAGDKKIDLSSLLNSNDSSSESSDEDSKKKKKKKTKEKSKEPKKSKKKNSHSNSESDDTRRGPSPDDSYNNVPKYQSYYSTNSQSTNYDEDRRNHSYENNHKRNRNKEDDDCNRKKQDRFYDKHQSSSDISNKYKSSDSRKRRSDSPIKSRREYSAHSKNDSDRYKRNSPDGRDRRPSLLGKKSKQDSPERERSKTFESVKKYERGPRQGMSSAERAAKLEEMAVAGKEREVERGHRVKLQRAADAAAAESSARPRSLNNEARALPDSLESRIRSNRHYIQRDKMHMNQNFARR